MKALTPSVQVHVRQIRCILPLVDKTSQDILLGVLATLDKHHWMFEVQTQR